MTQKSFSKGGIPTTWILLNSQSTIDLICNAGLLTNIHRTNTTMNIRCNAGDKSTSLHGHLSEYSWAWYFPGGLWIYCFWAVWRKSIEWLLTAHLTTASMCTKRENLKFCKATRRLYYFNTDERHEDSNVLLTTVEENKAKFSANDFFKATLAPSIQSRIGCPNVQDFTYYVENKLIPNCPITTQDIRNAKFIWGWALATLRVKQSASNQVRFKPSHTPYLCISCSSTRMLHHWRM